MLNESNNSDESKFLKKEIERLNKIIQALIERIESQSNESTDYDMFQTTVNLEDQIRSRTKELEEALLKNEKITRDLKLAKIQIEQNEQHLRDITSSLGEGLLVLTDDGILNFINKAACNMLGWQEEEIMGKQVHNLFHQTDSDGKSCSIENCPQLNVTKTKKSFSSDDDYYWRKNGEKFPVNIIATPIQLQNQTSGVAIAFRDTTVARKERDWLRLMHAAIKNSPISITLTDEKANIIYANPQVSETTGYSQQELNGRCISVLQSGHISAEENENLWKILKSGQIWKSEILDYRKDGSNFWEAISIAPVTDDHDEIRYFVCIAEDITEKKKVQTLLREMSFHDALTEIANRRRFDEYFDLEWRRATRTTKPLAIIMMDIDFFKNYNDKLGHQAGDECLKRVAATLKNKATRAGDLLARYGGEEFACILPETDLEGARILAEAMRQTILKLKIPHPDSSTSKYLTLSFGVAAFEYEEIKNSSNMALLHKADEALYRAKASGRNCVKVADQSNN